MKTLFYNGDIITLEDGKCDSVLINDDIIEKVGLYKDIIKLKDDDTILYDLKNNTLMPSFIDPHSHFFAVANNLLHASLDGCKSFDEIINRLKRFKEENNINDTSWIVAGEYDHNDLIEKKHINIDVLDKYFPNNPVVIHHKSGHNGVFNTMAFEKLDISINTKDIPGGIIEKIDGKLTGYMEENAFLNYCKKIPMPSIDELIKACYKAEKLYLSYGITSVKDGALVKELVPIYKKLKEENKLKVDVSLFMTMDAVDKVKELFPNLINKNDSHFKIGGLKTFLDGSPQSKTAWMKTPYKDGTYGYGTLKDEELLDTLKYAYDNNLQITAHCNGDMASFQYINNIKKMPKDFNKLRPVLIHGQLLDTNDLDDVKKLSIIPSYFVSHTYYWGDIHINNFGFERASKISPVKSTLDKDIIYTFHQDSPVVKPDMFKTIWCAVNRKTKSNVTIGKDECISVIDAIKAVTINAAYQDFEEKNKGSIKTGKKANLIIVNKNPLTINKEDIDKIEVLKTIKDGKIIYSK